MDEPIYSQNAAHYCFPVDTYLSYFGKLLKSSSDKVIQRLTCTIFIFIIKVMWQACGRLASCSFQQGMRKISFEPLQN